MNGWHIGHWRRLSVFVDRKKYNSNFRCSAENLLPEMEKRSRVSGGLYVLFSASLDHKRTEIRRREGNSLRNSAMILSLEFLDQLSLNPWTFHLRVPASLSLHAVTVTFFDTSWSHDLHLWPYNRNVIAGRAIELHCTCSRCRSVAFTCSTHSNSWNDQCECSYVNEHRF